MCFVENTVMLRDSESHCWSGGTR